MKTRTFYRKTRTVVVFTGKQGQESLLENKDRSLYWKTRTGVFTGKQGQESLVENKDRSPYRKWFTANV